MSEIKVNFEQLGQAADDLHKTSTKIQQELDQLEQFLKPLVATWEGSAQQAYQAAQDEWDKAAQNMQETTAKMGMTVNTVKERYQSGEKSNASKFG